MTEKLTKLQYQAMRRHMLNQIPHDPDCNFKKDTFKNECDCSSKLDALCQLLPAKPISLDKSLYSIFLSK